MNEKLKALIVLALGSSAVYFVLKAKQAQTEEIGTKEKIPLSYITPEIKIPKFSKGWNIDWKNGIVKLDNWSYDFGQLIEKTPLKHLKMEALPYQYRNAYQ